MGYYTKYNIDKIQPKLTKEEHLKIADFICRKLFGESAKIGDDIRDYLDERMQWYDFEDDITELSLKYPDKLFLFSGEGEEANDVWKKYFKNGKSFSPTKTIIWEEFDETKLK